MKIAISCESTVDLTKDILKEYDIKVVPFTICFNGDCMPDEDIYPDTVIDFVSSYKVLPKTSAVNENQYFEHFTELKKEYDAIIHFSLSSELSSAYFNAVKVSEKLENVFVIDSRTLSTGIGLLAVYASTLVKEGLSAKEIVDKCVNRIPFIEASFELHNLNFLHYGGRCSSLTCFGANLLKIRPQIVVKDGKMVSGKKYRGNYLNVVKNYCRDILTEFDNPDLSFGFLTYTTAPKEVLNTAYNIMKEAGFKKIFVTRAGGTITSHCGENCLGILYFNDGNV